MLNCVGAQGGHDSESRAPGETRLGESCDYLLESAAVLLGTVCVEMAEDQTGRVV